MANDKPLGVGGGWMNGDKSGEQSYERGKANCTDCEHVLLTAVLLSFSFSLFTAHTHICFNVTRILPCFSVVNVQPVKTCDPAMVSYSSLYFVNVLVH